MRSITINGLLTSRTWHVLCPVLRRSGTHEFSKHTGEMARVLKSYVQSSIDNTALGVSKLLLGAFDPLHQDIVVRSTPRA